MDQNAYIEQAAAHFRTLLTEQLNRQARMAQGSPAKDFSRMERIVIGLIPGDGIGPILMAQARRVLEKLLAAELAVGRVELRDIEGLTIENRTAQGKAIPDEVLASIKDCDVLLKGPTETPKGGTLESANVAMRRELASAHHICRVSTFCILYSVNLFYSRHIIIRQAQCPDHFDIHKVLFIIVSIP